MSYYNYLYRQSCYIYSVFSIFLPFTFYIRFYWPRIIHMPAKPVYWNWCINKPSTAGQRALHPLISPLQTWHWRIEYIGSLLYEKLYFFSDRALFLWWFDSRIQNFQYGKLIIDILIYCNLGWLVLSKSITHLYRLTDSLCFFTSNIQDGCL